MNKCEWTKGVDLCGQAPSRYVDLTSSPGGTKFYSCTECYNAHPGIVERYDWVMIEHNSDFELARAIRGV